MSARDRFSCKLRCPECGREGKAEMSEAGMFGSLRGDNAIKVESVSEGFHTVDAPSNYGDDLDFQCVDHAVSAIAK